MRLIRPRPGLLPGLLAFALIAAGVFLLAGLAWSLIAAGVLLVIDMITS